MADADVTITAGSGTKIDTRTVGAGTDEHRQVVVLGDPSTAAAVAPVSATDGLLVNLGSNNDVTIATLPALAAGSNAIGTVTAVGGAAVDAATSGNPVLAGGRASTADPSAVSGDGDAQALWLDRLGALQVALRGRGTVIEVDSAGLTTATTAYTNGDVLGTELTFANAVAVNGGRAVLESVVAIDNADVLSYVDLFLFDSASTPAANNAANSWSDANARKLVAVVPLVFVDSALNRVAHWTGACPIWATAGATSLFGVLVTRSDHTFFGAVGDIRVKLAVRYD